MQSGGCLARDSGARAAARLWLSGAATGLSRVDLPVGSRVRVLLGGWTVAAASVHAAAMPSNVPFAVSW